MWISPELCSRGLYARVQVQQNTKVDFLNAGVKPAATTKRSGLRHYLDRLRGGEFRMVSSRRYPIGL